MVSMKADWAGRGYDMDLGGYEFIEEPADTELGGTLVVEYSQLRETEYFPGFRPDFMSEEGQLWRAYFAVGQHDMSWPLRIQDTDTDETLRFVGVVHLNETDRECCCVGTYLSTGDDDDWDGEGHPSCQRCQGDGYVISPGGSAAFYAHFPHLDKAERERNRSIARLHRLNRDRRHMYVPSDNHQRMRVEAARWAKFWRGEVRKERAQAGCK